MITDFIFQEDVDKILNDPRNEICFDLEYAPHIKGLHLEKDKVGVVCLNSTEWKRMPEDILIKEISKTLVHETLHSIFKEPDTKIFFNGVDEEELICQILAGQLEANFEI